ncbi:hypothetical protein GCM10027294_34100 [Marinactinospora endophytica]
MRRGFLRSLGHGLVALLFRGLLSTTATEQHQRAQRPNGGHLGSPHDFLPFVRSAATFPFTVSNPRFAVSVSLGATRLLSLPPGARPMWEHTEKGFPALPSRENGEPR